MFIIVVKSFLSLVNKHEKFKAVQSSGLSKLFHYSSSFMVADVKKVAAN